MSVNLRRDRPGKCHKGYGKVQLCASFSDRSWYILHWGSGKLEDQGLDAKTWFKENIFDIILPEGPYASDYTAMARARAVGPKYGRVRTPGRNSNQAGT